MNCPLWTRESDALNNADSWAYFAADANGALRQNERDKTLVRP